MLLLNLKTKNLFNFKGPRGKHGKLTPCAQDVWNFDLNDLSEMEIQEQFNYNLNIPHHITFMYHTGNAACERSNMAYTFAVN